MGKRIISILAALALIAPVGTATAASKSPNLAKCNGKQRRPANPYGSILPTVDPVSGTSTPAGQVPERRGVEVHETRLLRDYGQAFRRLQGQNPPRRIAIWRKSPILTSAGLERGSSFLRPGSSN